jgi:hypothetical protein
LNKELYNKNDTPKLFNNKKKIIVNKPLTYINNDTGKTRHFTPGAQEWFNSIYTYDHNYIKSLPVADKHLMSLLKSYFNMQIKDENIKNKRNIIKNRRESTKRVFIGRGELKHSNNKVIITFYVYNTEGMFLWGNVKKTWENLYCPNKDIEISIYDDTKDKEVKSQYKPFNLISWLNIFENQYLLRTLINKTKKEVKNRILFTNPTPNSKDFELSLSNLINLLNGLGDLKNSQEIKLKIKKINRVWEKIEEINKVWEKIKYTLNEINTIVVQDLDLFWKKMNVVQEIQLNLNKISLKQEEIKWSEIKNKLVEEKTKYLGILFNKSKWTLINIYTKNKKLEKIIKINKDIDKKFDIISFNRPFSLKHGQILPINEDINNKRVIKLNRPLSLKEFLDQFDIDTFFKENKEILNKKNVILNKDLPIFDDPIFDDKETNLKREYKHSLLLLPLYLFNFNKTKFGMYLMEKLTHLVKSLYNKEVVFNIVNLKKMHLSTDIYTQAVVLKLRNRDNKLYRVLKSSLRKIKIPNFKKINEKKNKPNKNEYIDNKIRNSLINSMFTKEDVKDPLNNLLLKFFPSAENLQKSVVKKGSVKNYSISLIDYVLMYLKHIKVRGIRVEAKGRLTRRFTASRSVFKMKWKGGLKNVDSSFKGLSTIMLRGYVKSNAQYSFLSSKNRNGAFGVKGWVSNK